MRLAATWPSHSKVRSDESTRRVLEKRYPALGGFGVLLDLVLAWLHWLGLLVGGMLVSLPTTNWKRGVLAGLGFGALTLLVFAELLTLRGALVSADGMGQITALTAAIPLVTGAIGGLARALKPTLGRASRDGVPPRISNSFGRLKRIDHISQMTARPNEQTYAALVGVLAIEMHRTGFEPVP